MKVDFYRHSVNEDDINEVVKALKDPFLSTGSIVSEFESKIAKYTHNPFAVGVMSCTHALELSLRMLGIGSGDEVITTPLTFIATVNAILYVGAKPILVDVEKDTGNIDPKEIKKAVTDKTKAIIAVHLYGLMCDMKSIREIADEHNLYVVEDAAHCVEGTRDGYHVGHFADATCLSFYATKNLTSGEGGAVLVKTQEHYDKLLQLRMHGMDKSAAKRHQGAFVHWDVYEVGLKANMSNISASMMLKQIDRLDQMRNRRDEICEKYDNFLKVYPSVWTQKISPNCKSAHHLFTMAVHKDERDKLIAFLKDKNIGVTVNYRCVHTLTYYEKNLGYKQGDFPNAEFIGNGTISLPLYPSLTEQEINYVCQSLKEFLTKDIRPELQAGI